MPITAESVQQDLRVLQQELSAIKVRFLEALTSSEQPGTMPRRPSGLPRT